jgi:hypothetical protein
MEVISSRYLGDNSTMIIRITEAVEYLKPAKIIGDKPSNPYLMITKDEDHRNVTRIACNIAIRCDLDKLNFIHSMLLI